MIEQILFLGGPHHGVFRNLELRIGCSCVDLLDPSELEYIMKPPNNLADLDPRIKTTRYYRSENNLYAMAYGVDAIFRSLN